MLHFMEGCRVQEKVKKHIPMCYFEIFDNKWKTKYGWFALQASPENCHLIPSYSREFRNPTIYTNTILIVKHTFGWGKKHLVLQGLQVTLKLYFNLSISVNEFPKIRVVEYISFFVSGIVCRNDRQGRAGVRPAREEENLAEERLGWVLVNRI